MPTPSAMICTSFPMDTLPTGEIPIAFVGLKQVWEWLNPFKPWPDYRSALLSGSVHKRQSQIA